jgi:hypothetical protein
MEMPPNCAECPLKKYMICKGNNPPTICVNGYVNEIPKCGIIPDCPLIPVPPHGRLIDEKYICDKIRPLIENPYCYNRLQVISETLGSCLQIVRDAPTIIPAEPAEEEMK